MLPNKVHVPAAIGNWMNTSTKKAGGAADQNYSTQRSNNGSVFGARNRSMQVNSQMSQHSAGNSNLLMTGKNILGGNGHDDKMSTSAMSAKVPLAKNKGRNVSSKCATCDCFIFTCLLFYTLGLTMTAREFVMSSMRKGGDAFGVDGYHLAKTMTNFDKPLVTKMHAG